MQSVIQILHLIKRASFYYGEHATPIKMMNVASGRVAYAGELEASKRVTT
jgi:hypothetical protein